MPLARRAFTLVELLVVIAVIAVLASLVMTAAFRAMDMGRHAQCRSNLSQIGKGFWMYLSRWTQMMPAIGYPSNWRADGRFKWWYDAIEAETQHPKLAVCPAKPQTALGYGYNVRWADPVGSKHLWNQSFHINITRNPSATIAFADAGNVSAWENIPPEKWMETDSLPIEAKLRFPYRPNDSLWRATCSRPMPRHRGRASFLMFDGNVQAHRVENILNHDYGTAGCLFDNQ